MVAGPLGYEPTDLRFKSPRPSHLRRSRSIARPSHRAASHPISAVAPRFVPKSVPNTARRTRRRLGVSGPPSGSFVIRTHARDRDRSPLPVSDGSAATTDSVVRAHDHRHPSTTSRWRHRPDRRDSCGHCATIRHWRTRSPYSTSRHTGTGSCIRARPLPGPTTSRSPPHSGCSPVAAPAPSIAPAGPRCAGPDPKDLLGQTRLLLDRPPLHRHRLPTVPAGMTETPATYAHPPPSASTRHLARADHSALARPAHPHPSAGSPACSAPETIADRARARTEPIPVPLMQP